jgi:hypothetical protein
MNTMKIKTVWVVVLLVGFFLFFLAGFLTGRSSDKTFYAQVLEYANANVALADYQAFRDISLEIKVSKNESARCLAEFYGIGRLDVLGSCLETPSCRASLEKKAREGAPEVLGEAPMPIELRAECHNIPNKQIGSSGPKSEIGTGSGSK